MSRLIGLAVVLLRAVLVVIIVPAIAMQVSVQIHLVFSFRRCQAERRLGCVLFHELGELKARHVEDTRNLPTPKSSVKLVASKTAGSSLHNVLT